MTTDNLPVEAGVDELVDEFVVLPVHPASTEKEKSRTKNKMIFFMSDDPSKINGKLREIN